MDRTLFFIGYYVVGILLCILLFMTSDEKDEITLSDLMLVLFGSLIWPIIVYYEKGHLVIYRKRRATSDDNF